MPTGKSIWTTHKSRQFVIVVAAGGALKYLGMAWSRKRLEYTAFLNKARRFQSEKQAQKHAKQIGLCADYDIRPVTVTIRLEE